MSAPKTQSLCGLAALLLLVSCHRPPDEAWARRVYEDRSFRVDGLMVRLAKDLASGCERYTSSPWDAGVLVRDLGSERAAFEAEVAGRLKAESAWLGARPLHLSYLDERGRRVERDMGGWARWASAWRGGFEHGVSVRLGTGRELSWGEYGDSDHPGIEVRQVLEEGGCRMTVHLTIDGTGHP